MIILNLDVNDGVVRRLRPKLESVRDATLRERTGGIRRPMQNVFQPFHWWLRRREVGQANAIAHIIQLPVHTRGRKKCTKVGRGIGDSGEIVFGSRRGFEGLEVSYSWDQLGGGIIDDPEGAPGEGGLDAGKQNGEGYGGEELHFSFLVFWACRIQMRIANEDSQPLNDCRFKRRIWP